MLSVSASTAGLCLKDWRPRTTLRPTSAHWILSGLRANTYLVLAYLSCCVVPSLLLARLIARKLRSLTSSGMVIICPRLLVMASLFNN